MPKVATRRNAPAKMRPPTFTFMKCKCAILMRPSGGLTLAPNTAKQGLVKIQMRIAPANMALF